MPLCGSQPHEGGEAPGSIPGLGSLFWSLWKLNLILTLFLYATCTLVSGHVWEIKLFYTKV